MTDAELIEAYCTDMEWRRLSHNTVNIRRIYLTHLSTSLGPFGQIKSKKLKAWLADPARKLEAASQATYLVTFHGFYVWAQKNRHLKKDPTIRIDKPKVKKGEPHPIPEDELEKALVNADSLTKCWLVLGAYAGCRCQEIALMSREDVHEAEMRLFIAHGKGNKTRWVPLSSKVLEALNEWGMPPAGRLWDLNPAQLSKALNAYLHDLGIESTAHSLRHRFATRLYQSTKDIIKVQRMLGHESVATTQIYAASDLSSVADDVEAL